MLSHKFNNCLLSAAWKRHLNVLKRFLFPKINFERYIIPAKI